MNQWLKWIRRGVYLLILPLLLTGVMSYWDTHEELEYCKTFVPYQSGFAGIQEGKAMSTIFWTDEEGALQECLRVLNMDVLTQNIKSYDQLVEDEEGHLYVVCSQYDQEGKTRKIIYQVQFAWERLVPMWEIPVEELDGIYLSGQIIQIQQETVYFTMYQSTTSELVTYAVDGAGECSVVNQVLRQNSLPERCTYTPQGLVALYRDQGVYVQDKRLYPTQERSLMLLNGLGYDEGQAFCLDFYEKQSVVMTASTDEVDIQPISGNLYLSKLEQVHPQKDGTFTACLELHGALVGCYWDGQVLHHFTSLEGQVYVERMGICFLLLLGVELVVVSLVWLIWLRKRKDRQREKRRFVSVRTRISVISLLVTVVGTAGIMWVSATAIEDYSRLREQNNSANAAQTFLMMIQTGWQLEEGELGANVLPTDAVRALDAWIEEQKEQGLPYDYEVFSRGENGWYCIYSADLAAYAPAEYVVGERVQASFAQAMDTGLIQSLEEQRSIGTLQYAVCYGGNLFDPQGKGLIVAAVSNGYQQKAIILNSVVELLRVVVVASLVLLLAENALVWFFMHRLRLLNRALARSSETEKWDIADFYGHDEVAETAQTMKTMTGNIQVYLKDIQACNTQYERLIPKDVIHLMGVSSFTKAQAGEMVQRDVLLFTLNLFPGQDSSPSQLLQAALQCVREREGMVLDFQESQLTGCFLKAERGLSAFGDLLNHPELEHRAVLLFSPATLEVGVTGDDDVKRVLLVSQEEQQLEELKEPFVRGDCLGFFLHMDTAEIDTWMHGFSCRLAGWLGDEKFYELISKWGQSPKYATRERFEQGIEKYHAGEYGEAGKVFKEICQADAGDTLAAWYWMECRKRMEGEGI